jgi:SAM-dependent methyltransferase
MYPCIGRWGFLNLHSIQDSHYDTAVERLKHSASSEAESGYSDALLDIGCCIGQLLRKLVHDGIEPTRLFGTDLHPEFISIGAELFHDEGRGLNFAAGDILDPEDEALKGLDGKITLVHAGNFFHLFTWEDQVKIGMRIIRFLHRGTIDAIIFGRQIGTHKPREKQGRRKLFLHNEESLQKLWNEIGAKTGTRWRVQVSVNEKRTVDIPGFGEEDRYIRFGIYQFPVSKGGVTLSEA